MSRVTQRDLARYLGISQDAVSTALRGDKGVSEKTRALVKATARELGYRPNTAARAARTGRFDAAAMLLQVNQTYLPTFLLHGVARQLSAHNMHMVLAEIPSRRMVSDGQVPKLLRELSVDGLLIDYVSADDQKTQQLLRENKIPAIWINDKREGDCAYPDELDGATRMTQEFIKAGHRNILFTRLVTGPRKKNRKLHYAVDDRQTGYENAMRQSGLTPRIQPVHTEARTGGRNDSRLEGYLAIWNAPDRPTAVVAAGLAEGAPAAEAAAMCNLRPHRDTLIGCFHHSLHPDSGLPIIIWQIPHEKTGEIATDMLISKIAQPTKILPPQQAPYTRHTPNLDPVAPIQ